MEGAQSSLSSAAPGCFHQDCMRISCIGSGPAHHPVRYRERAPLPSAIGQLPRQPSSASNSPDLHASPWTAVACCKRRRRGAFEGPDKLPACPEPWGATRSSSGTGRTASTRRGGGLGVLPRCCRSFLSPFLVPCRPPAAAALLGASQVILEVIQHDIAKAHFNSPKPAPGGGSVSAPCPQVPVTALLALGSRAFACALAHCHEGCRRPPAGC